MTKEELIKLRSGFLPYERAEEALIELRDIYQEEYVPLHGKEEYYDFIMEHNVGEIELMHPQSGEHHPEYIYEGFCVPTQHVQGFTKQHVLDRMMDIVKKNEIEHERINNLQTVEEFIENGQEIDISKEYEFKLDYPGSTMTVSGDHILEIKKIGYKAWRDERDRDFMINLAGGQEEYDKWMNNIKHMIRDKYKH